MSSGNQFLYRKVEYYKKSFIHFMYVHTLCISLVIPTAFYYSFKSTIYTYFLHHFVCRPGYPLINKNNILHENETSLELAVLCDLICDLQHQLCIDSGIQICKLLKLVKTTFSSVVLYNAHKNNITSTFDFCKFLGFRDA